MNYKPPLIRAKKVKPAKEKVCEDHFSNVVQISNQQQTSEGLNTRDVVFPNFNFRWVVPFFYILFLILPIFWMISFSFRAQGDMFKQFSLLPLTPTLINYTNIFSNPALTDAFINAFLYVGINMAISISVALPAAYAFARYSFLGDRHLFFGFLACRITPPVVLMFPLFQLYSALDLVNTPFAIALAHCLFNIPISIWILESFIMTIPVEVDETAFIDGYSLPGFFVKILIPLIKSGIGVAAFFCFIFSWVEVIFARILTLTAAKPIHNYISDLWSMVFRDFGMVMAVGVLMLIPGAALVYFVRNHIARGFIIGQLK